MRIKICGITNVADAVAAAELGADAIGLNFYPQSKRYIDEATAREIIRHLPPFVAPVALFVKRSMQEVSAWTREFSLLHTIQMHADAHELPMADGCRIIPAFRVRDAGSLQHIQEHLDRCHAAEMMPAAILVDAHVPGEYGGTGQTAPWQLLADFKPRVPLILAGGLTPDNVAEAIRLVQPYAVDVASGVESEPGKKDFEKMRRFIAVVREAAGRD